MAQSSSPTRRLLLIGFGGLLLLLAFAGLNGISVVRFIQDRNEHIRSDYVLRESILQQLRADIYQSGTYVRDFLLEPDPALADSHRKDFFNIESRIRRNSASYAQIAMASERQPLEHFNTELHAYLESLAPALQWGARQRHDLGYSFMKTSLLPRRTEAVRLADQLSALNQEELGSGNRQVRDLFTRFQRSLTIVTLLSVVSGGLLAGFSVQRLLRSEKIANARLEELTRTRTALRELSARLIEVQESERRAIARELHDEVGQAVSGLLLGLGNVSAYLSLQGNSAAVGQLRDLHRLAERTVAAVRDLSLLLRPSMLDDLGLLPALRWQAREISRTRNISVQVMADTVSDESLSDDQRTCIYRIVQESLHNVVRHAGATSVDIRLTDKDRTSLVMVVQDNGCGFDPRSTKGVGILGMEERVRHLNGRFHLESVPGEGTSIRVELPIADPVRNTEVSGISIGM